jgi:Mor family transcriptional regulator
MFVPSAIEIAVHGILAMLYSDFRLDTQTRNVLIRRRHVAGESITDLAREYGISPQRVYQIGEGFSG